MEDALGALAPCRPLAIRPLLKSIHPSHQPFCVQASTTHPFILQGHMIAIESCKLGRYQGSLHKCPDVARNRIPARYVFCSAHPVRHFSTCEFHMIFVSIKFQYILR
uniref:Uncharacterized protein n=1 Tax=Oryza rufipogon TaxID=4529 RepID=A0A0E0PJ18_ORYRU